MRVADDTFWKTVSVNGSKASKATTGCGTIERPMNIYNNYGQNFIPNPTKM